MTHKALLKTFLVAILVATYAIGYCQSEDGKKAKEKEQETYEKQKELKSNIKKNQTQEDIILIMGEPEEVETAQKGSDITEIWYYDGRDTRIEFKNKKTSTWFIRFFPDKPPKEKQKTPKEKCSLCEESKKTKKEGK